MTNRPNLSNRNQALIPLHYKKRYSISIATLIMFSLLIITSNVFSQSVPAPKIASPNAASLGAFGEVPVGLFTGVPDISIAIYTLSYGSIQVPVSLRYHPSSVKPATHPGWVGLGWDLQSIGMITRSKKGLPDEACIPGVLPDGGQNSIKSFYPAYLGCANDAPGSAGSEIVNVANWDDPQRLRDYFTFNSPVYPITNTIADVEVDEFSFNCLGHSGKFYYTREGWKVVSEEKINVEFNGFFTTSDLGAALSDFAQFQTGYKVYDYNFTTQPRIFKEFTLTMSDGTKFIFGGNNAVEFTSGYGGPVNVEVSAWLLKKVIDPNKNEIVFDYRRRYPTCNMSFGTSNMTFKAKSNISGNLTICSTSEAGGQAPIEPLRHGGTLIWPMYLSKISSPLQVIDLQGSVSTSLRYTDHYLTYNFVNTLPDEAFNNTFLLKNNNVNNIQWDQLDQITIRKANNEEIKRFSFAYSTTTDRRLTLNSLTESGGTPVLSKTYAFNYRTDNLNDGVEHMLPIYDGNYTDHWGFYNGKAISNYISQIIPNGTKETDNTYTSVGLLKKITYPTKGYTKFTWQAHDYSRVVNNTRVALSNKTGYAGGSRIFKMQHYDIDGTLATEKTYYYRKNYTIGSDPAALASSGVLNGLPQYAYEMTQVTADNTATIYVFKESYNSLAAYSYAGQGSYLGYDEVVELNKDNSYTINFFTNYGEDINQVTHFDKAPNSYIGWDATKHSYFPMSSLETERGKPVGVFMYTPGNILVQKSVTTYRADAGRFNDYAKLIDFNNSYACSNYDALILASARKEFNYSYYPVKTEVTTYSKTGTAPVLVTTNSAYNGNNLIAEKKIVNSDGVTSVVSYKYPPDFPAQPYIAMTAANMISPVIEVAESQIVSSVTTPLKSTKTNYFNWFPSTANLYLPQTIQVDQNGSSEIRVRIHDYNIQGNVLTASQENGPKINHLWSFNGQYPIAKIENAEMTDIKTILGATNVDNFNNQVAPADATVRTFIETLRNSALMKDALITTYTYDALGNITSITDPKQMIIYYEYDGLKRLNVIRDQETNIMKTYDYTFKN